MFRNKKKVSQNKLPLTEEEQDKLIKNYLSDEELKDLLKEGFNKEQIACVAKNHEKISKSKFPYILNLLIEIFSWIVPLK